MAVLLNDVWHSAVIDFGCVISRILWIKFKFSWVKVCVVVGYGRNEGSSEEREKFWNDLDRNMDKVGDGYRSCVLGDLNGWIGDRVRASILVLLEFQWRKKMGEELGSSVVKGK